MRNITYKYNLGDVVRFKSKFHESASWGLAELADTQGVVEERRDYNGPCYKLAGMDSFCKESCFEGPALSKNFTCRDEAAEANTLQGPETKCDTESSGEPKKKTKTNIVLLTEALTELSDVLDYIASERGEDDTLYVALSGVETKLETVVSRYARKVVQ
jgi:hypothetical protein